MFWEAVGELVLLLAGQLPALGHVLGGVAHVVAVEGVHEAVLQHGVHQLEIAHLGAVAHMGRMGGERHGFLAAGHDDAGVAVGDLLHADGDGAKARAAELVEAPGGLFLRNARVHGRLPGRVLALARDEDLPEDHLVHLASVDLGALEGRLDGDRTQIVGGGIGESAVEGTDGGARGADDDDAIHDFLRD